MSNIKVFDHKEIRTKWSDEVQDWYFSVVDVVAVLRKPRPRKLLEST